MPPKRGNPSLDTSGRPGKKLKMTLARSIVVQEPAPAAGPSRLPSTGGQTGVPDSIDVEKFAESRSFEIRAMQEAMKNAKSASTHRAWQELPRHLRRRAASHNVRRVPLRLRQKSRSEMDSMRRKALGRSLPKRGKARREPRSDALARRQKDKKWLETHIWHAKRMHMENMWGYRLASQPTEKSFRPSHRASLHGSILHDASYYSLIELRGAQVVLKGALEACCDASGAGPASKRFLSGVRACETCIYEVGLYPYGYIGPLFVMWRARAPSTGSSTPSTSQPQATAKRKRKAPKRAKTIPQPESSDEDTRTIWIRSHPAIFERVLSTLRTAVSSTLESLKKSATHAQKAYSVEVADMRDSVNVFEITGPKSSQVICGALTPTIADHRGEFKKFWASLSDLQTTGSIPSNMVIGFTVLDPRLNFPPKNAKVHVDKEELPTISSRWECFPTTSLAQSDIWNQNVRDTLKVPRFKKKELDTRRAQNPVPGTSLKPTAPDNRVPILLVQRSVRPTSSACSSVSLSAQSLQHTSNPDPNLHGWTLIVPKGWGMPFLNSLVYTGTRVAGQRERAHQAFEAGAPHFPRDFPTSTAYDEFAAARATTDSARWERKPPAKRASWDKLGTPSPWTSDWHTSLGLAPAPAPVAEGGVDAEGEVDMVPTQRDHALLEVAPTQPAVRPWLLQGAGARAIVENISRLLAPAVGLLSEVNALRHKRELPPLDPSVDAQDLLQGALVHVRVVLCGRGSPEDMALIYALKDQEARTWTMAQLSRGTVGHEVGEEPTDETELSKIAPSESAVIGFVTTGSYSLSRGQGYAIGAIALAKFLELQEQAHRLRRDDCLVKLRNRDGTICRAARVEFLE
ncbi:POP1-domain-containing protein [Gloeopeniophorella convolvens]|nr:POP1-domain-containing protein [Gloeopeniophorella convolvens]